MLLSIIILLFCDKLCCIVLFCVFLGCFVKLYHYFVRYNVLLYLVISCYNDEYIKIIYCVLLSSFVM